MTGSQEQENEVFKITYREVTREICRSQLAKAPDSLLGKILLGTGPHTRHHSLTIPASGSSLDCAAWLDGDAALFEVISAY